MDESDVPSRPRLRLMSFVEQNFISSCIISALYGVCLIVPLAIMSWTIEDLVVLNKNLGVSSLAIFTTIFIGVAIGGFLAIPFSVCPGIPILYYQVKHGKLSQYDFIFGGVVAGIIVGLFFFAVSKKSGIGTIGFWTLTGVFINSVTYYRCYRPKVIEKTLANIKKATS